MNSVDLASDLPFFFLGDPRGLSLLTLSSLTQANGQGWPIAPARVAEPGLHKTNLVLSSSTPGTLLPLPAGRGSCENEGQAGGVSPGFAGLRVTFPRESSDNVQYLWTFLIHYLLTPILRGTETIFKGILL